MHLLVCQTASVNNPYRGLSTPTPPSLASSSTVPPPNLFSSRTTACKSGLQQRTRRTHTTPRHLIGSSQTLGFARSPRRNTNMKQKWISTTNISISNTLANSSASHQMDSIVPPLPFPSSHASSIPNNPYSNRSVSSSEAGVAPDGTQDVSNAYIFPPSYAVATPAVGPDREEKVMRYREKRKSRRFEKTIRYASRKAYAETRPRVKGRFAAKRVDTDDADVKTASSYFLQYPLPLLLMEVDEGFGVVPPSSSI